jgi:predicted nucleic acid-binding protein
VSVGEVIRRAIHAYDQAPPASRAVGRCSGRTREAISSHLLARDLVHVATCQVLEIEEIISVDTDFDAVEGLRIDPDTFRPETP